MKVVLRKARDDENFPGMWFWHHPRETQVHGPFSTMEIAQTNATQHYGEIHPTDIKFVLGSVDPEILQRRLQDALRPTNSYDNLVRSKMADVMLWVTIGSTIGLVAGFFTGPRPESMIIGIAVGSFAGLVAGLI